MEISPGLPFWRISWIYKTENGSLTVNQAPQPQKVNFSRNPFIWTTIETTITQNEHHYCNMIQKLINRFIFRLITIKWQALIQSRCKVAQMMVKYQMKQVRTLYCFITTCYCLYLNNNECGYPLNLTSS